MKHINTFGILNSFVLHKFCGMLVLFSYQLAVLIAETFNVLRFKLLLAPKNVMFAGIVFLHLFNNG